MNDSEKLKKVILELSSRDIFKYNGTAKYLDALIDCLPADASDDTELPFSISFRLRRKTVSCERKGNFHVPFGPIEKTIEKFREKRSGCRVAMRDELRTRFFGQTWDIQLEILKAFLENDTRLDTEFVSDVMRTGYWHFMNHALKEVASNEDIEFIKKLFFARLVKYIKSPSVSKCALSYLPDEILLENAESIQNYVGYAKLAVRLSKCSSWKMDRSRLDDFRYLYVLAETGGKITDNELYNIIYKWILNTPFDSLHWESFLGFEKDELDISLVNIRDISMAVRNIGKLGNWRFLVDLEGFDEKIRDILNAEFLRDKLAGNVPIQYEKQDEKYRKRFIEIAKRTLHKCEIADSKAFIDNMKSLNPGLESFIDEFDLTLQDS